MKDEDLLKRIYKISEDIGIQIPNAGEEVFIADYIEDSIAFMSFILEIEEEFHIEVPDEYLSVDMLETFTDVANMIRLSIEDRK